MHHVQCVEEHEKDNDRILVVCAKAHDGLKYYEQE